jgi:hypothetical protein
MHVFLVSYDAFEETKNGPKLGRPVKLTMAITVNAF